MVLFTDYFFQIIDINHTLRNSISMIYFQGSITHHLLKKIASNMLVQHCIQILGHVSNITLICIKLGYITYDSEIHILQLVAPQLPVNDKWCQVTMSNATVIKFQYNTYLTSLMSGSNCFPSLINKHMIKTYISE